MTDLNQKNYGFETLRKTVARFRSSTPKKTSIEEMTLEQALSAQSKYLAWREKAPNHPDAAVKIHIYTTYLLPRILELQFEQEVSQTLIHPAPTLLELQKRKVG